MASLQPPGLALHLDFVTPHEERALLAAVDALPWEALRHRRVQHHGVRFIYGRNGVDPRATPTELKEVVRAVAERARARGIVEWVADQCTVNDYGPGDGIPPHVDTHSVFEEALLSLSLGAAVPFEFRAATGTSRQRVAVVLLPRSLLVLRGEARYGWLHGIAARKTDEIAPGVVVPRGRRVSVTFRKVRDPPWCACAYPALCDMQAGQR